MLSISVSGRLCSEPEVKVISEDLSVTSFRLVSNRYDKSKEDNKGADFVDAEIWGKRGVTFAEHFNKGDGFVGYGRLQISEWKDKESGENRSRPVIKLFDWEFSMSKKDSNGGAKGKAEQYEDAPF